MRYNQSFIFRTDNLTREMLDALVEATGQDKSDCIRRLIAIEYWKMVEAGVISLDQEGNQNVVE